MVSYAVQSKGPVLGGLMLDNGLALLASGLLRAGYDTRIFDYNNVDSVRAIAESGKEGLVSHVIEELDGHIKKDECKAIGFKFYANGFAEALSIAAELKKRNDNVLFVGGGPHVSTYRGQVYSAPHARQALDILIPGEADVSLLKAAEVAYGDADFKDVPGAIYLSDGRVVTNTSMKPESISMDDLPFPVYDKEVYDGVEGKVKIPVIEDSRGCSYGRCVFCAHPLVNPTLRKRDVGILVEEIEHDIFSYGMRFMRIGSSSPEASVLEGIAKNVDGISFSAFGRSDKRYDFSLLEGKLSAIFFGVESADRRILQDVLNKTRDADSYLASARNNIIEARERGIVTVVSMIVPSPFETEESMMRSVGFLCDTEPDFVLALPAAPIPGTPLHALAKKDPDSTGIFLQDDFERKMMMTDIDLLRPSEEWESPFGMTVDGSLMDNPFAKTAEFLSLLREEGMLQVSDELVLIAKGYYGSLGAGQDARRDMCSGLSARLRESLAEGDHGSLYSAVSEINRRLGGGLDVFGSSGRKDPGRA